MQALCKTSTSAIKPRPSSTDGAIVAIAVASPSTLKSFRLAGSSVRSTFETTAVGALVLSAFGLWLLVIPVELLGFVA